MNTGDHVSGMVYEDSEPAEDMRAFDALPKMVRRKLANAVADINSIGILAAYEDTLSPIGIIQAIDEVCAEFIAHAYADRGLPA